MGVDVNFNVNIFVGDLTSWKFFGPGMAESIYIGRGAAALPYDGHYMPHAASVKAQGISIYNKKILVSYDMK